jgi:hypothetical protein
MTDSSETLYAKLLGETAAITWAELQPFFARGSLLWVAAALDLVEVARALAEDERETVGSWMRAGQLGKAEDALAGDLVARDPPLWAVVVAPWVLVQEHAGRRAGN